MTADLEILFKRQKTRDLDPSRHLGHILNKYDLSKKLLIELMLRDYYLMMNLLIDV